jgi:hypothetical protein
MHFGHRVEFHVHQFNRVLMFISHYALSCMTWTLDFNLNELNLSVDGNQNKYVKAFFTRPFELRLVIYEVYVMYPRFRTRQTTEKNIREM